MITNAQMEQLSQSDKLVYGYVYQRETHDEPSIFELTPQNTASFILSHSDASSIVITDCFDMPILNTFGPFIDQCSDQDFLQDLLKFLIPMQMGEAEPQDFACTTEDELEDYLREYHPEL